MVKGKILVSCPYYITKVPYSKSRVKVEEKGFLRYWFDKEEVEKIIKDLQELIA